jgi:uncharacterized membrane protein (UPF0127 family)
MHAHRWVLALLSSVLLAWALPAHADTAAEPLSSFPRDTLAIATPDARMHRFNVWIADNDRRRMQGLMFVKQLAPTQGMLFVYSASQSVAIWMKNTYIPLDIVFIRADGRIARITPNAKPHSLASMESGEPVLSVLELPAGTAKKLNIHPGAIVMHRVFGTVK